MLSNNNELSILTYNVSSIMSSASYLSDILLEGLTDVCGLSALVDNEFFFLTLFHVIMIFLVNVTLLITKRRGGPNVELKTL